MVKVVDAQHATIDHLAACSKLLESSHQLGIVHHDINKCNFFINADWVTMVALESAPQSDDGRSFKGEMGNLSEQ
jgi:hypothetical protein